MNLWYLLRPNNKDSPSSADSCFSSSSGKIREYFSSAINKRPIQSRRRLSANPRLSSFFSAVCCLILLAFSIAAPPALASNSIYGLDIRQAFSKDLFSFFRFRLSGVSVTKDGFTQLQFRPPKASPFRSFVKIFVTLDESGKIRRMRMLLSRKFIDDKRQGMFARDVAKSFVQAAVPPEDSDAARSLVNEIFFRQKLTEVKVGSVISDSAKGKKVISGEQTVFKLGSGKLMPGDIIIIGDRSNLPSLPEAPSALYLAFSGERKRARLKFSDTALSLSNLSGNGESILEFSLMPNGDASKLKGMEIDFRDFPVRIPTML